MKQPFLSHTKLFADAKLIKSSALLLTVFLGYCGCSKQSIAPQNSTNHPEATLIYYGYGYNSNTEIDNIMSVNFDGTGTKQLFTTPSNQYLGNAVISSDNKNLLLSLYSPVSLADYNNLYAYSITNSALTTIINESGTANANAVNAVPIAVTPATPGAQSQLLYYLINSGLGPKNAKLFELHTSNIDGTSDKKIPIAAPSQTVVNFVAGIFQDQKTLLLNVQSAAANTYALATCNIDGSDFKTLGQVNSVTGPGIAAIVAGTPSQGTIIFYKTIYDNNNSFLHDEIWVSNPDLSGQKKLNIILPTSDLFVSDISGDLAVSTDGKTLFFSVSSTKSASFLNRGIYSCNLDGSNVKAVVPVDLTGVTDYLPLTTYQSN